jgi:hypothetical protein
MPEDRRERRRLLPLRRIDRLPVVVAVEQHRPGGARHAQLAVDERVARRLQQLGLEAAAGQQTLEVLGVTADVRAIRGDVRNRERLDELTHDGRLVRLDPPRHRRPEIRLGRDERQQQNGGGESHLESSLGRRRHGRRARPRSQYR